MKTVRVLGLDFAADNCGEIVSDAMKGRFVVAPSAPVLVDMVSHPALCRAIHQAELVLPDSGLMVLMTRLLRLGDLRRVSGLAFLRRYIGELSLCEANRVFWVLPTPEAKQRTLRWFERSEMVYGDADCYVAPQYDRNALADEALLQRIVEGQPHHIVIAIGGGVQEVLGAWLRPRVPSGTSIYCIGAALAFLTGDQGGIPVWADRIFVGWLLRCLANPVRFMPRYVRSARLIFMLLRHGSNSHCKGAGVPRLRERGGRTS